MALVRVRLDRSLLVLVHSYVGLTMAGSLTVAGPTGSLLAWSDKLEAVLAPSQVFVHPYTGAVLG
jgi:uncharacterized iron-regulated membrane protein